MLVAAFIQLGQRGVVVEVFRLRFVGCLQLAHGSQLLLGEVHVLVVHCLFPALFAPSELL